jgi:hypothetical protein
MGVLLHGYPMPLALAREAITPNSHFARRGGPERHASPVAVVSGGHDHSRPTLRFALSHKESHRFRRDSRGAGFVTIA